jgi:predicted secreted hydrolase
MNLMGLAGRRHWLKQALACAVGGSAWTLHAAGTPAALSPKVLKFPRDAGAHTDFKTEWWYITGFANVGANQAALGFQITFFRSRVDTTQAMQSTLAAKQLVFAHAAVTDVQAKKLWHDQRIARWSGSAPGTQATDLAWASSEHTAVTLKDWYLTTTDPVDSAMPRFTARIAATDFSMDLQIASTQPVLLQGDKGLSRKGPQAAQASYYYSRPQLQVQGTIALQGRRFALGSGSTAWLDHEWSQALLDPAAVGWDWIGINLSDGSALTAFQLRDKNGAALWDGGSFRSGATTYTFSRGEVLFRPMRTWRSALSKASYPVEWIVRTPADFYTVKALVDNQELDSRQSTGAIYWEGLCEVWDSNNTKVGRGYLEMTGYAAALQL